MGTEKALYKIVDMIPQLAFNHADLAKKETASKLKTLISDIAFKDKEKFNISHFRDMSALMLHIAIKGTTFQQSRAIDILGIEPALMIPDFKQQLYSNPDSLSNIIKFVSDTLGRLAESFGTDVKGGGNALAYDMMMKYGGLNQYDWMAFFINAKRGEYKQEYQHIASRGINREFIISWLDQYCDQRFSMQERKQKQLAIQSTNNKPIKNLTMNNSQIAKANNIKKEKLKKMLITAEELRQSFLVDSDISIGENKENAVRAKELPEFLRFQLIIEKGITMPLNAGYRPGYYQAKFLKEKFEAFKNSFKDHAQFLIDLRTLESTLFIPLKSISISGKNELGESTNTIKRNRIPATEILASSINDHLVQNDINVQEFHRKVYRQNIKKNYPLVTYCYSIAGKVVEQIHRLYFKYLEDSIETKTYPIEQKEHEYALCRYWLHKNVKPDEQALKLMELIDKL